MSSLVEQIENKCIHFTGLIDKECGCGVNYHSVSEPNSRPIKIPCFKKGDLSGGRCPKAVFKTREEAEKEAKEIDDHVENTVKVMMLVKKHFSDTGERQGKIECPCGKGSVNFSVAEINNHVHANCEACDINFME